jgi:hypothetical protein
MPKEQLCRAFCCTNQLGNCFAPLSARHCPSEGLAAGSMSSQPVLPQYVVKHIADRVRSLGPHWHQDAVLAFEGC